MVLNIRSRISSWHPEQQERLIRVRDYAVATISTQPFKGDDFRDETRRRPSYDFGSKIREALQDSDRTKVCPACMDILEVLDRLVRDANVDGKMEPQHVALDYTLFDLEVSAGLGCHMCAMLEASVMRYIKDGKLSPLEFGQEMREDSWLWLTTNASRMDEMRCEAKLGMINMEVLDDTGAELSFFPPREVIRDAQQDITRIENTITPNTGDESTFQIVEEWLRVCRETHTICANVRPAEKNVPRRLLQLGQTTVQVVENTDQALYACLSHCWGSQANVPHQLTEGAQYEPFEVSELPKTFRDAIKITKRLGLEHLWIDCFCIVQGSKEDWIEQSAVMAQIYSNSVFTIAALAATNTNGGCFRDRNPLGFHPLHTRKLSVEPRIKDSRWRLEVEGGRPEYSPLHTRAWVVQERLSSPRTIFYGAMGVYWECRCAQASESHLRTVEDVTDNFKTLTKNLENAALESTGKKAADAETKFLDRWQHLVEVYTTCSLSFVSDKLVALSGITKDVEKYSGKRYVQGLWENDLPTGLLWIHVYSGHGISREDNSGRVANTEFPTWSWASMTGKIQYFTVLGQVVWTPEISIEDETDERRLRIRTWTRPVSISAADDDYIVLDNDGSKRGDLDEDYLWYHDEKSVVPTPMHVALIQRVSISERPFLYAVRCLVVKKGEDEGEGVWERLGMTIIRFNDPGDDPFPLDSPTCSDGQSDLILV